MSNHDHWLERQGGCYDQIPSCRECGYELCEHGLCRYCAGCAPCDAEEEAERISKKPAAAVPSRTDKRIAG
jgi:hypothetical protein